MGATAGIVLSGANTASQFASQQTNASGIVSQARFQEQVADLDAKDAVARGTYAASIREMKGRQAVGAQRAGFAASGIDANSGTPGDIQTDEAKFTALDAQTIRNNAALEAWGYKAQAQLNTIGAEQQAANERTQSYSTLLTGGAKTYGLYRDTRSEKLPTRSPNGFSLKSTGMKPGWK